MLEVDAVTLAYHTAGRDVVATREISFSLLPGERLAILGPSGCGKSSLLKAIGGFLQPASGHISLYGKPITSPGLDRIMVFQEFDQLLPWLTAERNVMFPLLQSRRLRRDTVRATAAAYLRLVGVADFADAYPHMLSGGMKQRVAIARAMAMRPEVLLMDEPFGSLDALTRGAMQDELYRLWQDSTSMLVFVTHSIEEAIAVGDRIMVISARPGRVIANLSGLPGQSRVSDAFVALRDRLFGFLDKTDLA